MNLVIIAAHGLNCHWLGPYGNEWVATPSIDALACSSIVFDRHFANDPSPLGFTRALSLDQLKPSGVTAILVDDRKQPTSGCSDWDRVVCTNPGNHKTPGAALLAAVKAALDLAAKHERWLLLIQTDRLIPPWDFEFETYQEYAEASGGFIETREVATEEPIDEPIQGDIGPEDSPLWHRLHNSFAAAVTAFDEEIGKLLALFRKRGLVDAAWIITSGHGWPLGEHGIVGTIHSRLHEELVHVPLIVRLPADREAMRRVQALTQTTDLGPTILDMLGTGPTPDSLVPLLSGQPRTPRELVRHASGNEHGLRTDEWAFLSATGDQPARLYRKPDDIWEVNDLAARQPDECDALNALLDLTKEQTP